jgi:hypothetical protein
MIEGTLIGESVRVGAELSGVRLTVRKVSRAASGDTADAIANVLDRPGGWYADFRTPAETFVVYAGRVFRYSRGDSAGRAEAAAYGRSVGVPENQLDWPV